MATEGEVLPPVPEQEEEGGPVKSFLEHLEDLRWVIIRCGSAVILAMAVCLIASPQVVKILTWPLDRANVGIKLQLFGPIGGFMVSLKLGFYAGLVLALPFVLYFVGSYVLPALRKKERKYFLRAFYVGGGAFLLGVTVCYFLIMPLSLRGLTQYNKWVGIPAEIWRGEEYFEFVAKFLIGVGLLAEVPIVLLTLVRLGVISRAFLAKGRRYMFMINFAFVAVLTPADMVTTFLMAVVLQLVFEGCLLVARRWERQKEREEEAAAAAEAQPGG